MQSIGFYTDSVEELVSLFEPLISSRESLSSSAISRIRMIASDLFERIPEKTDSVLAIDIRHRISRIILLISEEPTEATKTSLRMESHMLGMQLLGYARSISSFTSMPSTPSADSVSMLELRDGVEDPDFLVREYPLTLSLGQKVLQKMMTGYFGPNLAESCEDFSCDFFNFFPQILLINALQSMKEATIVALEESMPEIMYRNAGEGCLPLRRKKMLLTLARGWLKLSLPEYLIPVASKMLIEHGLTNEECEAIETHREDLQALFQIIRKVGEYAQLDHRHTYSAICFYIMHPSPSEEDLLCGIVNGNESFVCDIVSHASCSTALWAIGVNFAMDNGYYDITIRILETIACERVFYRRTFERAIRGRLFPLAQRILLIAKAVHPDLIQSGILTVIASSSDTFAIELLSHPMCTKTVLKNCIVFALKNNRLDFAERIIGHKCCQQHVLEEGIKWGIIKGHWNIIAPILAHRCCNNQVIITGLFQALRQLTSSYRKAMESLELITGHRLCNGDCIKRSLKVLLSDASRDAERLIETDSRLYMFKNIRML